METSLPVPGVAGSRRQPGTSNWSTLLSRATSTISTLAEQLNTARSEVSIQQQARSYKHMHTCSGTSILKHDGVQTQCICMVWLHVDPSMHLWVWLHVQTRRLQSEAESQRATLTTAQNMHRDTLEKVHIYTMYNAMIMYINWRMYNVVHIVCERAQGRLYIIISSI